MLYMYMTNDTIDLKSKLGSWFFTSWCMLQVFLFKFICISRWTLHKSWTSLIYNVMITFVNCFRCWWMILLNYCKACSILIIELFFVKLLSDRKTIHRALQEFLYLFVHCIQSGPIFKKLFSWMSRKLLKYQVLERCLRAQIIV